MHVKLMFQKGSTHLITPRNFVDDLKVITLGGVGSRVIPNGLREPRGQRQYQDFYDEKYYTKDGPRPQPQAAPSRTGTPQGPKAPRLAPTPSYGSATSTTSSSKTDDKKKKKGLFRF